MSELEIPERAVNAALWENCAGLKSGDAMKIRLEAAAPIIAAAELRSFVAALQAMGPVAQGASLDPRMIIGTIAGDLKRRADELDPGGSAQ